MKPVVTKNSVRTHFLYSSWKYLILIVGAIFAWNIVYTTTRYQPPEEKKIEWYYQGIFADDEPAKKWLENIRQNALPDIEEISLASVATDETYGDMQLMVWMAAAQGDLYHLTTVKFKELAATDAFIDLQPYLDNGTLKIGEQKLYYTKNEEGYRYPAGIYTDNLIGLEKLGLLGEGKVMGILTTGGNTENTLSFMNILMESMSSAEANETSQP